MKFSVAGITGVLNNVFKARTFHDELKERLLALGYDLDTLAHAILAIVVGATVEMSQSLLHLVNFYLSDDKKKHMILQALGEGGRIDSKNESTLQDLVLEALSKLISSFDTFFGGL